MIAAMGRRGVALVFGLSALLLLLGLTASGGFFNIDEFVYYAGARALHDTGGFAISNGFEKFTSNDLYLWLFVDGPKGVVPQYPIGTALLGAPLVGFLDQKALIALNVAAGVATLFATHALARRLFESRSVADLAVLLLGFFTFWSEYVVGLWPHSVSLFFVTLTLCLFLAALDRQERVWLPAMLAGLATGTGMMFRLEGALILPSLTALTILYATRPMSILLAGATGLLPMAGVLAWSNKVRFGTWNPLSYGSSGGGTDAQSYLVLIGILVLVLAILVLIRIAKYPRPKVIWGMLAGLILLTGLLFPSQFVSAGTTFTEGVRALLFDATSILDPRLGMSPQADGTLLFWGLPKKALGQSLPWLGGLAVLIGLRWGAQKRSVTIALVVSFVWMLPFILRSWHGGLGLNMRYFLPTLPVLASLIAWIVLDLINRVGHRPLFYGVLGGFSVSVLWLILAPGHVSQFHQIVTVYVLFLIIALSLVAGFIPTRRAAMSALVSIGCGLGFSADLAFQDYTMSQSRRALTASRAEAAKQISGHVVIYGAPEIYANAFFNSNQLLALPDRITGQVDMDFIADACAEDYRILVPATYAIITPELSGRLKALSPSNGEGKAALMQVACDSNKTDQ